MDPSLFYSNGMWKPRTIYRRFTSYAVEYPRAPGSAAELPVVDERMGRATRLLDDLILRARADLVRLPETPTADQGRAP